jgi:hypothetical protein
VSCGGAGVRSGPWRSSGVLRTLGILRLIPRWTLLVPIGIYRLTISRILPPACRFDPTCSAYAFEAIRRHGALKGSFLGAIRLLKCHPFHPGGEDPVPPANLRSGNAH